MNQITVVFYLVTSEFQFQLIVLYLVLFHLTTNMSEFMQSHFNINQIILLNTSKNYSISAYIFRKIYLLFYLQLESLLNALRTSSINNTFLRLSGLQVITAFASPQSPKYLAVPSTYTLFFLGPF